MNALKKLRSRKGAAVIYALLFLLTATMVSVLILDASVTTAKRLHDDKVWEQDYLSLTSAGKLIKECLENTLCNVTTGTNSETGLPEITVSAQGPFAGIIENAVRRAVASGGSDPYHSAFTIDPEDASGIFRPVSADFSIIPDQTEIPGGAPEDSYKISAVLTYEGSDMKLYLTASASRQSEPPTDHISWRVTMSTKEGAE
ncbi:MAG: hypothetical protein IJV00_08490 [Clostridia bacterium]|nr:hypothetical protein [Clostridia bacterium]